MPVPPRSFFTSLLQLAVKAFRACALLSLLGYLGGGRAQQPQMYLKHFVPGLTGDSLTQADAALQKAGLTRGDVEGPQTATARVIGQSVPAGTEVRPGATIALRMSLPQKILSDLVTVPALNGMTRVRALSVLNETGLRAGDINGPAQGFITEQQPKAGTQVVRQTAVALTFALRLKPSPQLVAVPALQGRTKAEAAQVLAKAGLAVGILAGPPDSTVKDQVPEAGDLVRRGTPVDLSMAEHTVSPLVFAVLIPLLAVAVWLILKIMRRWLPKPEFVLLAHRGNIVYSSPRPQAPLIRLAFSLRDRMPPPQYTTVAPPRVRRQGESL